MSGASSQGMSDDDYETASIRYEKILAAAEAIQKAAEETAANTAAILTKHDEMMKIWRAANEQ